MGKAQPTLTKFFTTPKTKPAADADADADATADDVVLIPGPTKKGGDNKDPPTKATAEVHE